MGSGEIVIDDSEWEELIEEVGGDAVAARELAVRRRSSTRSANNFVSLYIISFFIMLLQILQEASQKCSTQTLYIDYNVHFGLDS